MVFVCISLMISDVEHLFMSLLFFCVLSLNKCLFRPSGHSDSLFFWLVFVCLFVWIFLLLISMGSLYILHITPYQICDSANISELQIFSRLPFPFFDDFFLCAKELFFLCNNYLYRNSS